MITGTVLYRRPRVILVIRGSNNREAEIETVLDTGFEGFLALPPSAVLALELPFLNYFNAFMADGNRARLQVYGGTVVWDSEEREVEILGAGSNALLGASLLDGHDVQIEFVDGGTVTIAPL